MAYTVLARKYRSQTFEDVIGQEPIAQTLINSIKTDRVAHAYLFTGTRGVGKTTMARVLAKALNCLAVDKPTPEPCCKCVSCITVNAGEDIDVIEIDGATNNGVEQVRELRQNAIYRPARARFKIYIIDEVHMLSTGAFNALLKILEEPPSHVKFIFATTEPNKVIATIQSRCQIFDFRNIGPAVIAEHLKSILKQEKIKYEDDLIMSLAKMANGSMRDGLSLLDRLLSTGIEPLSIKLLEEFLGQPNSEKLWTLIEKISESDAAGTLAAIEDLINVGISEVLIADSLIDYMRDLMVIKSTGIKTELVVMTEQQRQRASELAEKFDIAALVYNISTLEKLRWSIKNSDTSRALLEASLLRFALSEHFINVESLLSQIKSGTVSTANSPAIKKKIPIPVDNTESTAPSPEQSTTKHKSSPANYGSLDLQTIQSNWSNILQEMSKSLGPGTSGLLSSAKPSRFKDSTLTLEFAASSKMHKTMCESNGRASQIQSFLSEHLSMEVDLKFEIVPEEQTTEDRPAEQTKGISQKRNEIMNDPAVKTVLLGLDATITNIEEDQ
ncbi:MAG: DNA polymerase III subunit gamma/tau [Sedimentisphaerales bacterium]|nr:DNA polymerase III subunit gamma/tau [Sedimentisphaerales bacterium]